MDIDILKESVMEYCENLFALGIVFLRKNNDEYVFSLIKKIELLEEEIRVCDNKESLNELKEVSESIGKILEEKFNE